MCIKDLKNNCNLLCCLFLHKQNTHVKFMLNSQGCSLLKLQSQWSEEEAFRALQRRLQCKKQTLGLKCKNFYLVETALRVWVRWGRAEVRDAPPSEGRRGLTLDGGSRSSRPLVKAPGGCMRRGWGRRTEVSVYSASTLAKLHGDYGSAEKPRGSEQWIKVKTASKTFLTSHSQPGKKQQQV